MLHGCSVCQPNVKIQLEIHDILLLINDMMRETVRVNFVGSDKMHPYFLNNCPSFCAERTIPLKVQIVQKSTRTTQLYIRAACSGDHETQDVSADLQILGYWCWCASASQYLQIQKNMI